MPPSRSIARFAILAGVAIVQLHTGQGVAHAAPQVLRVSRAYVKPASSPALDDGRFAFAAVLDDEMAGTLESDLLAGRVRIGIGDGAAFAADLPIDGCARSRVAAVLHCRVPERKTWLVLRKVAPARYHLQGLARELPQSATGSTAPRRVLTMTLRRDGSADLVDVISDCRASPARSLSCRDQGRPNIVFIVSDDQRADTLGNMPLTLAALADRGVTFTNAFVTTPLCAPSRASMLTGLYARNHGILSNAVPLGGASLFVGPDASTLATWLHAAGYRTGMYGKYLTDYRRQCPPFTTACYIPPGWDEWHVFFNQRYYDYQLAENAGVSSFAHTDADYSTDVIAAKAVEFIESAHGQPFFLHVGFHAPHTEGPNLPLPATRHAGSLRGIPPWRPESWDEPDISDKPPWIFDFPRASQPIGAFLTYGTYTDAMRRYQLETLKAMDEAIAAIRQAVDATGQAENTVIVFTSDNGYLWGEHRIWSVKDYPYEESVRVPLIVRYPPLIPEPREDARTVLNIDLPPTLAALARVRPTSPVDGRSFVPLLHGETAWRDDFVLEWWNGGEGLTGYAGLRSESVKYVNYENGGLFELYDLAADPLELQNLAGDPSRQDALDILQARLESLLAGAP